MKQTILLALPLCLAVGCGSATPGDAPPATPGAPQGSTSGPRPIKLVLFPYIPDAAGDNFQGLIDKLESGFEQAHPDIDLRIEIDPNMDFYDLEPSGTLHRLLGSGDDAAQIVEIDTLLLGSLIAHKWVQPTGMKPADAFPAAQQAVSVDDVPYGIPTYLCTNVLYARSNAVQKVKNGVELMDALAKIDPKAAPIAGDFEGSWTLPSMYVDAWADTNGTAKLASAYSPTLDPRTMTDLRAVVHGCEVSGKNPCMDKTYKDNTEAEKAYALGSANSFFGYTERLHYIRAAKADEPLPSIISAPMGDGTHPIILVDALVFNPGCTGACLVDNQTVAAYMDSVPVRALIAFSQDAPPGAIPRYLLQANQAFYKTPSASADPMYQAYLSIVSQAHVYPNQGFPEAHEALKNSVLASLTSSAAKAAALPNAVREPPRR